MASDNNIRIIAGKLELLLGLEPDHGLVHEDAVEDRAERVLDARRLDRDLDGFGAARRVVRIDPVAALGRLVDDGEDVGAAHGAQ